MSLAEQANPNPNPNPDPTPNPHPHPNPNPTPNPNPNLNPNPNPNPNPTRTSSPPTPEGAPRPVGVTVGEGEGRGGRGRVRARGVLHSSHGDGLVMPSPRAHIGTRPQSLDAGDARTPRARETADGCVPLSCSYPVRTSTHAPLTYYLGSEVCVTVQAGFLHIL